MWKNVTNEKCHTSSTLHMILISNFRRVLNLVCILLGISAASDCGLPTFRNPLSVPSSKAGCKVWSILHTLHPALEDGTYRGFRNVGKPQSDAGEIPKRIHTRFIWSIYLQILVMLDALLLRPSLHFTIPHPTTLHSTSLHLSKLHLLSLKLHPTTLHYPLFLLNPI